MRTVAPSGAIMRVGVSGGSALAATTPTLVVKEGYFTQPGNPGRTYDISSDGQRFLMIKGSAAATPSPHTGIVVVLNWTEELKHLTPPK